jgi:hypothetical protein
MSVALPPIVADRGIRVDSDGVDFTGRPARNLVPKAFIYMEKYRGECGLGKNCLTRRRICRVLR